MRISLDDLLFSEATFDKTDHQLVAIPRSDRVDRCLQQACRDLCKEFSEFYKPELGCLRRVQLEVGFEPEARTICKPRSVPFAMQEELAQAYDSGIARGIWTPTSFNNWNYRRSSEESGADFQQTCFMHLRRLLCSRQPAAGNTSTPVATSWRNNAKIAWWLWFHQDWPGRCLQPGQVSPKKSWTARADYTSRSSTSERTSFRNQFRLWLL